MWDFNLTIHVIPKFGLDQLYPMGLTLREIGCSYQLKVGHAIHIWNPHGKGKGVLEPFFKFLPRWRKIRVQRYLQFSPSFWRFRQVGLVQH